MYKFTIKYQLLALAALFVFVSCGEDQGLNIIDPGLTDNNSELLIIDGGENATLDVVKGGKSYFNLAVRNTGTPIITYLQELKNGWSLKWKSPVNNDTTYEGVTLYSTYNEEYWKPVNYLLNNREEIEAEFPDAGYREMQAAIWMLLDFTDFDPETASISDLPDDMQANGQYNFDLAAAEDIADSPRPAQMDFNTPPSSTYAVVSCLSIGK